MRASRSLAATALLVTLVAPAAPAAATTYDHSETIVVGPDEPRITAASSGSTGDDIVFNGRGSFHSVGLSQYGARAQAMDGRSVGQITGTYYTGTSLQTDTDAAGKIRVAVVRDTPRIRVVARGGTMEVRSSGYKHSNLSAGTAVDVVATSTGTCTLTTLDTTDPSATSTPLETDVRCPTIDPSARAEVFQPSGSSGWSRYREYGRDAVVDVVPDRPGSTWLLDVVVQLPLEQYLYGLAESPYSWESAALQAQAVAGRSFALHRMKERGAPPFSGDSDGDGRSAFTCSCHVWDSQADQVYKGYDRELTSMWDRWKAAVDATTFKVVTAQPGQAGYGDTEDGVVQTFYSASSHGRTEHKHEVFFPSTWAYMVSVEDGWSLDPDLGNPYAAWSRSFPRSTVAAKVGLTTVDSVQVTERRASGSARTVVFRGGGATKTLTGDQVRRAFGLLSNGFGIGDEVWGDVAPPPPSDLFVDDDGSPHEQDIDWLANRGITKGCNPPTNDRFCPGSSVTREQMAAFLTRALELPPGTSSFTDTGQSIFRNEIGALAGAGITKGCNPPSNTRFCPTDVVTRAQMASFLARALDLPPGPSGVFTDVPAGSTHERTIGALKQAGITLGCNPPSNTRYCPDNPVTRAQMATFLRRALD